MKIFSVPNIETDEYVLVIHLIWENIPEYIMNYRIFVHFYYFVLICTEHQMSHVFSSHWN